MLDCTILHVMYITCDAQDKVHTLQVDPAVPLFGYIGRLEEQKGVDILCAALPTALQNGNIQVAILGTGQAWQTAALFQETASHLLWLQSEEHC